VENQVLVDSGYRGDVVGKDLTGYTDAKPRPGTLELWLEPVPAR